MSPNSDRNSLSLLSVRSTWWSPPGGHQVDIDCVTIGSKSHTHSSQTSRLLTSSLSWGPKFKWSSPPHNQVYGRRVDDDHLLSCHVSLDSRLNSSSCTDTVVSSRVPSFISSLSEDFSQKSIFKKTKKFPLHDWGRGLDITEQSLRDVFNDVSKYRLNISVSLNRLFP
jgi:hypothetical protein